MLLCAIRKNVYFVLNPWTVYSSYVLFLYKFIIKTKQAFSLTKFFRYCWTRLTLKSFSSDIENKYRKLILSERKQDAATVFICIVV